LWQHARVCSHSHPTIRSCGSTHASAVTRTRPSVVAAAPLLSRLYAHACCHTHVTIRSCGASAGIRSPDHCNARVQPSAVAVAPVRLLCADGLRLKTGRHSTTVTAALTPPTLARPALSSLGSMHTPAAHITQAHVQMLSRASDHSGAGADAVTRVSAARHHSGTGAMAVTRV
jgi:hypothetical protein